MVEKNLRLAEKFIGSGRQACEASFTITVIVITVYCLLLSIPQGIKKANIDI